jgi:hypothetical protein
MDEDFIWGLIPVVAIIGGITYAIVKQMSLARVRELEVRERIAMIEKGLIPPPESNPRGFERAMEVVDRVGGRFDDRYYPYSRHRAPERHRSAGITLMGVGFGVMFMIAFGAGEPQRAIGVGGFLVLLGVAFFINGVLERRSQRDSQNRGSSSSEVPPPSGSTSPLPGASDYSSPPPRT